MVRGVNPSYILIVQKMGEEVPTIINCHLALFSPRFRLVFERVTISSSACLHARYAMAPLMGIQLGVPSMRPIIRGWSGGVFRHRVSEFAIELQLIRNWKGRRDDFLRELINCMSGFDE